MIKIGSESTLYFFKEYVLKKRNSKPYVIPALNKILVINRTKKEFKVLKKLWNLGFNVPKPQYYIGDTIKMSRIKGTVLKNKNLKNIIKLCVLIKKIHSEGIIHGDLCRRNIIDTKEVLFLIDFGLSFYSSKIIDRTIDLAILFLDLNLSSELKSEFLKIYGLENIDFKTLQNLKRYR